MFYINVLLIMSVLIQLILVTFNISVPKLFWFYYLAQLVFIIFSLVVNHYQWQLIPIYLVYILCLLIFIIKKYTKHSIFLLIGKIIFLLCCWAVFIYSVYLYFILPLPIITKPTGMYFVGTTSYTITPPTCNDPINGSAKYKVFIKVWYPAENDDGPLARYPISKEIMDRIIKPNYINVKSYTFLPLNKVDSYSFLDAQLNTKLRNLPLIIYNGGSYSIVGQNSMLLEELASQGFIVVSIAHYYGDVVIYNDGSSIMPTSHVTRRLFNNATGESIPLDGEMQRAIEHGQNIILAQKLYFSRLKGWQTIIQDWESDSLCVINYLGKKTKSPEDIFYEKININNIGVIGHSLGGFTAGNLCAHLDDVKACVFLDTIPRSDYFFSDMKKPSLFIYPNSSEIISPYLEKNPSSPIKVITIENANHYSFMEQRILAPLLFPPYRFDLITTYHTLNVTSKETTKFLLENFSNINE
jgi:hypothetical protein